MRLWRIATSSTAFTAMTQAGAAGLSLLSGPMLSRSLGAEGRGVIAGVSVTLAVLSWVCFLGVPNSLGYHAGRERSAFAARMGALTFVIGAACAVVLWFAAPSLAQGGPVLETTGLRIGAALLPFAGLALCGQELVYGAGRLIQWNIVRAIPTAGASVAVIILFLVDRLDLVSGLAAYLGAFAAYCLLGCGQLIVRTGRAGEVTPWATAMRYAGATWMASSSLALFGRLDQVLMVPFSTADRLGRYAVAVTVVASANLVPAAIGVVSYSRTRLSKSDALVVWRVARRRLYVVGGSANLVVVLVGPWLVPALFGPEFRSVGLIIFVLALGQLPNDIWMLRVYTLSGVGKQGRAVAPSWISTVLYAGILVAVGTTGQITELDAALATLGCALVRPAIFWWRSGPFAALLEPGPDVAEGSLASPSARDR